MQRELEARKKTHWAFYYKKSRFKKEAIRVTLK